MSESRKEFLKRLGFLSVGSMLAPGFMQACRVAKSHNLSFDISLAEWSLNQALFDGELTHMEFPGIAKKEFDIDAVEYVNQFFKDKAEDKSYLGELNQRCVDLGVNQLLIMVDGEGNLAVTDDGKRKTAVENHYKWVEAANDLNCHSIRVNLFGNGTRDEVKKAAVESLGQLAEFAKDLEINIIVENHGGWSSDAGWLANIMQQVDMENCGTLPDFGNFCIKSEGGQCVEEYDRYKGLKQMIPYAKGVSAKSYAFNKEGEETTIDFRRMLKIISESDFNGHIGIEYEGDELQPYEGIRATKNLLLTLRKELA